MKKSTWWMTVTVLRLLKTAHDHCYRHKMHISATAQAARTVVIKYSSELSWTIAYWQNTATERIWDEKLFVYFIIKSCTHSTHKILIKDTHNRCTHKKKDSKNNEKLIWESISTPKPNETVNLRMREQLQSINFIPNKNDSIYYTDATLTSGLQTWCGDICW